MKKAKKARGFVREARVPRLTLATLQARIRQRDASIKQIGELHTNLHTRYQTDRLALLAALKDAVKLIEEVSDRCIQPPPRLDGAQIKRLETIRLLSLGV